MTGLHLVQADDPRPPASPDLIDQWSGYMAACGCTPASIRIRTESIRQLQRHAGVEDVLQLTRDHVIAWLGRPIKPWTRVTYYRCVKAWSLWLTEFGHDPHSALLKGVPKPKTPPPVARPVDDAAIERLLALKLPPRPHAYVRIALYQAMRVHEIAQLRAEDFDLDSGWLLVAGKGGITKPIPIHPEIAKLADVMPAYGLWFPSTQRPGEHVDPRSVSLTIKNAMTSVGIRATAHQLRDTAATRMQRTVKDIRLTQSMLRHTNISSTMKYTEASNDDLQKAVRSMDWTDAAQQPARPISGPEIGQRRAGFVEPVVDLAALPDDQLGDLARQLLTLLASRQGVQ